MAKEVNKYLLPEECKTKEELYESLKMNVKANLSIQRPIDLGDIDYAIKTTMEWTEQFLRQKRKANE